MKNLFKKGAVAAAVAGSLMASSMASADSVLAPLVIGINNGTQTYFSIKARGNGTANARMSSSSMTDLHYVWFKKNLDTETGATAIDALDKLGRPCEVSNNNGKVSPWDMVFQRAVGNSANGSQMNLLGAGSSVSPVDTLTALDASSPNGYTAGDFVGFAVITDAANKNANPAVKDLANEGELSGFGYIVDPTSNFVMDYKLLNNHRSKVEGDFSAGFISKKSVDFSWLPTGMAATEWHVLAAGEDMLKADSGSGSYDATVYLSQDTVSGSVSPQAPLGNSSGVYNNDEKVTSGAKNVYVTCMGRLKRENIMSALQLADTINGGWKRMSIQNSTKVATDAGGQGSASTVQVASGAMIYKAETIDFRDASFGWVTPEGRTSTNPATPSTVLSTTLSGAQVVGAAEAYGLGYSDSTGAIVANNGAKLPRDLYKVMSFQPEVSGHLSATPEPHPNRPY